MVKFRSQYIAKDVGLYPDRILRFHEDDQSNITIEIVKIIKDDLYRGRSQVGDLLVTAYTHKKPTRKIEQWLINPDKPLPVEFETFAGEIGIALSNSVLKLLKQLRWRNGYRNSYQPSMLCWKLEWCVEDGEWSQVIKIGADGGTISIIELTPVSEKLITEVNELRQKDFTEPLYHELFKEAWNHKNWHNPNSALVIAIAAAETGIKQLIAKLVPNSEWLIQNMQSPPIVKILKEYLPLIPSETRISGLPLPPLPESLIASIEKGVNLRNQIVHGKKASLKRETLESILKTIDDLLYILDFYEGHLWALENISHKTRAEWLPGNP
jgi:hypothetical protein